MIPQIRWRGLRLKIIAWAFVPTAIILVAVGLVSFYAFQRTTRYLLIERNRELILLTVGQLAREFEEYSETLATLSRPLSFSMTRPEDLRIMLSEASNRLSVFDGGVVVTDAFGIVIASEPERPEIHGHDWSNRNYFRELVRLQDPVFSDVVSDGPDGELSILIAVPISGANNEFLGMLTGMFRLGATNVSPLYGNIVKLRVGEGDFAHLSTYIVDRNGLVLYHSNGERIGEDFSSQRAVDNLLQGSFPDEFFRQEPEQSEFRGSAGAIRVLDVKGRDVVAYFSLIPGTHWGLVSEASWDGLLSVYQSYLIAQSILFVLGVAVPALVVGFGIRRITQPIYQLMSAARQVARGYLGHQVHVKTGDELEELVEQFNHMSVQLAQSYENLEQRVEERTRDLAALNAISVLVNRSLDLEEILKDALDKILEIMHMEFGAAYRLEGEIEGEWISPEEAAFLGPEHLFLQPLVSQGVPESLLPFAVRLPIAWEGVEPLIHMDEPFEWDMQAAWFPSQVRAAFEREGIAQLVCIPLKVKGKLVGAIQMASRRVSSFTTEEIDLLNAIGREVGVAVENARLHEAVQQSVALEERARLARELHDSVTQSLYSVTLLAEAAARLFSAGDTQTAADHLRELRDTAQESLAEMRLLIYELRPVALEKSGLADALRFRLEAVETRSGIKTELQVEGVENLSHPVKVELYQIAQESLNNILKHAHARNVKVSLRFLDHQICLGLCDDGIGFDPASAAKSGGLGLAGIKERVEKIGGAFFIDSAPGKGTCLRVELSTQSNPELAALPRSS